MSDGGKSSDSPICICLLSLYKMLMRQVIISSAALLTRKSFLVHGFSTQSKSVTSVAAAAAAPNNKHTSKRIAIVGAGVSLWIYDASYYLIILLLSLAYDLRSNSWS